MARMFDPSSGKCRLVDDLDFSTAVDTVQFRLDGVYYEVALSTGSLERLRDCLAEYLAASHVVGRDRRGAREQDVDAD
jgi:Lsr2